MSRPLRGEIWWAEEPDLGRRPCLVLTRDAAIEVLSWVLVAPATRTIRGIPTEVLVDEDDGMPEASAITLDNICPVPRSLLVERITRLRPARMAEVCVALGLAVDC